MTSHDPANASRGAPNGSKSLALLQSLPPLRWAVYWVRFWSGLFARAFVRSWGRDVMLYTGGVTFFALLAIFPAIAILIGFYKAVLSMGDISQQVAAVAENMPTAARAIFIDEIDRLSTGSFKVISTQSAIVLVIGAYAAHRGFKALLAGLNLIHDEKEPHGFFKFNLLAFLVALAAFILFTVISGALVTWRIFKHAHANDVLGLAMMPLDGMWTALGLLVGLTMLYRYAMSHRVRVAWKAAIIGGLIATAMALLFSWLCAIYVEQIVHLGATYGSVGAVVVLLIWLSWNVNAIFYGGALATELEIAWQTGTKANLADNAEDMTADITNDRIIQLSERREKRS